MFKLLSLLLLILLIMPASALPKYAEETGQSCSTCHTNPATGELNDVGKAFSLTHTWPPETSVDERLLFIIGFIHVFSVVLWIGAIFFVHLVHTPDIVAMGGAPKKELILGWSGIFGTGISGVILTTFKFRSIDLMLSSESGKIVLLKILIYIFMVSTAVTLTLYLNKKFRSTTIYSEDVDIDSLKKFERLEKQDRILVAVGGLVFDFSESPLWKNGEHAGRHEAWKDLTEEIKASPHGISVLKKYRPIGYTSDFLGVIKGVKFAVSLFKFFAYANLILGIVALALSSYMRWML